MRPSSLQSRLIDTYGTLCDETGLNRLPFAEARKLSIETLRDLIAWRQHVKKHADNECPPPYTGEPAGGWDAFRKRGPEAGRTLREVAKTGPIEDKITRQCRVVRRGTGLVKRQQHGQHRIASESFVEDYLNQ